MALPLFATTLLVVFHKPEYIPRIFVESATSPVAWVAWAFLGAMGGVTAFSGLLVAFFLLYSPIYLVGKAPMIMGKGAWTDRREVQAVVVKCFAIKWDRAGKIKAVVLNVDGALVLHTLELLDESQILFT